MTKLVKPLVREISVSGAPVVMQVTPRSLLLRAKGARADPNDPGVPLAAVLAFCERYKARSGPQVQLAAPRPAPRR